MSVLVFFSGFGLRKQSQTKPIAELRPEILRTNLSIVSPQDEILNVGV
jgi:hypothetical protein